MEYYFCTLVKGMDNFECPKLLKALSLYLFHCIIASILKIYNQLDLQLHVGIVVFKPIAAQSIYKLC